MKTGNASQHLSFSLCHFSIPDSSALNLLDELPRRRLVAILVDQADGENHRLELGAEMKEKKEKIQFLSSIDNSGNFLQLLAIHRRSA